MNKEHADQGFEVIEGTETFKGSRYGLTVTQPAVISDITFADHYTGDPKIIGKLLPLGYYPIRFSAIALTSGEGLAWREVI